MRVLEKKSNVLPVALVVALAAMLACDADSPTEPTQTPNQPAPTSATTGFAISVGLSPNSIVLGEATTVQVTVVARRTDTNAVVPRGSTAVLSTTDGVLTNEAGTGVGTTVTLTFGFNGTALATLTGVTVTAVVRAQIEQSSGQRTLTVNEPDAVTPFTLFQVTPNFGPPAGGTSVRIEGTGFSAPAEVTFGSINVPVLSVSSSVIRVLSPQIELGVGANLTVSIAVTINVGEADEASGTLGSAFTYTRNATPLIPKIISITPTLGPNEGGTRVTIFGEAFGSEVQVFFGDASRVEAVLVDVTPTRILVDTPSATGQNSGSQNALVSVRVVDLRSGFVATLGGAFQYGGGQMDITAMGPTEGLYLGGTLVTIFGTGGFEAPVAVEFGNAAQQVVSVSGTEIVARAVPVVVSCNPPSGPGVTVVNIETGEGFGPGPAFTYRTVTPAIFGLSPASAIADVVTGFIISPIPPELTMFGLGFDRQARTPIVTIDGVLTFATVTSIDPNPFYDGYDIGDEMLVGIPGFTRDFDEEACQVGDDPGLLFVPTDVNVVVTARDTGCTTTFSPFTYIPDNSSVPDPGGCRVLAVAAFSFIQTGGNVVVTDLSRGDPPLSIVVDFGDPVGQTQPIAPGGTASHFYATAATYTITLTADNAVGGANTATQVVIIP